ncbi:MAG: class I SAM-dependent methyltransferase, partial [Candidatus Ratteibacteria bacterium]|nr:class I SAM-dependent methyltransferase [Candidatus Ratteibacteria bacterium]
MGKEKITFSFGKNWEEFIKSNFSQERIEISKKHILDFLELTDLSGKYFLDIGCGSGLSSLAALDADAEKIVSFDVDTYSVKTTKKLRQLAGNPSNWIVLEGSILDKNFLSNIEPADIVYSWGVLHHTGKMWEALEKAAALMKKDALLYIALYTTTNKSKYWLRIKKKYNRASKIEKKFMEISFVIGHTIIQMLKFKNPLIHILNYKRKRGMSYFTDVKDWLGGYPYEDAKI